jgi:uroporphyrinogen III methyltransferase / synthase
MQANMSPSAVPPGPLNHRTVVAACSASKIEALQQGLEAMGARVVPLVVIEPRELDSTRRLDDAISSLSAYSWIIFTSVHGVSFFMKRWHELRDLQDGVPDFNRERFPSICAIGPATASALAPFGLEALLVASEFVAEGVYEALAAYHGGVEKLSGLRVLIPRAEEARDFLPDALMAAGVHVDVVACYRTARAAVDHATIASILKKKPDLMVFTSASSIRNMIELIGREEGEKLLAESTVAVIGPVTGKTAESFGKHADIVPDQSTIPALLRAIEDYYKGAFHAKTH